MVLPSGVMVTPVTSHLFGEVMKRRYLADESGLSDECTGGPGQRLDRLPGAYSISMVSLPSVPGDPNPLEVESTSTPVPLTATTRWATRRAPHVTTSPMRNFRRSFLRTARLVIGHRAICRERAASWRAARPCRLPASCAIRSASAGVTARLPVATFWIVSYSYPTWHVLSYPAFRAVLTYCSIVFMIWFMACWLHAS